MSSTRSLIGATVCLLVVISAPAAADDFLVIKSTVPALRLGTVVTSGQALKLSAGAQVSLINEAGKVVKLKGPYTGILAGNNSAGKKGKSLTVLASLVRATVRDSNSVAAIRAGSGLSPPNPYWIDVTQSATACLPAGEKPTLWRAKSSFSSEMTFRAANSGQSFDLSWSSGDKNLPWPTEEKVQANTNYVISQFGVTGTKTLKINFLPGGLHSPVQQAALMSEMGCQPQALRLLAQLAN